MCERSAVIRRCFNDKGSAGFRKPHAGRTIELDGHLLGGGPHVRIPSVSALHWAREPKRQKSGIVAESSCRRQPRKAALTWGVAAKMDRPFTRAPLGLIGYTAIYAELKLNQNPP